MESTDIIIIGAGLSGLCLAQNLTQENRDFLILEGRDRIGGRINTIDTIDGTTVEMGATWFFPHFQNLYKLMKNFNIELTEQYMKGYSYYQSNSHTSPRKIYSQDGDGMYRFLGGTKILTDTLYNNIDKEKVLLSSAVTEIRMVEDGIQVYTNGRVFKCQKIVTTIPPLLLINSVKFIPSLSKEQKHVLKNTHTWMGEANKAAISYQSPFWKEAGLSGTLYSNSGPFIQMHDQSSSDGTKHALVGFLDSDMSQLTFDERKTRVLTQLVKVFGNKADEYVDYRDTIWKQEKFTAPSEVSRLWHHKNNGHSLYQQPLWEGRLIIGGSETSTEASGYLEGAVCSAIHMAKLLSQQAHMDYHRDL